MTDTARTKKDSLVRDPLEKLYDLLPVVYRQRDVEQGAPLRALLQVITEQVQVIEDDISQLYDNWFIETAEDWVVSYIGDLIGYRLVHEAGEPGDVTSSQGQKRNKILIPRREVANTIRYRRRKGTLSLLEDLTRDVAGWSALAVEFYRLLGWTQAMNHLRPNWGHMVNLRDGDMLAKLNTPFDSSAHSVDIRRPSSHRTQGYHNLPSIGVFVWRLKAYSVTEMPAYLQESAGTHCYTFSILGNDAPLFNHGLVDPGFEAVDKSLRVPAHIGRRQLESHLSDYYDPHRSIQLWRGDKGKPREPIPIEKIVVADLTRWQYRPNRGMVALDPVLGRIAFSPRDLVKGLWVSYYYGFSADLGGGEYARPLSQPGGAVIYRIVENAENADESKREFTTISAALKQWQDNDDHEDVVIEIAYSGVFVEQINIKLKENKSLQLRAASGARPVIRLLDWHTDKPDALSIDGAPGARFTLDGLLITGRGIMVRDDLESVTIRHSTLVPGWALGKDCKPRRPAEPSLELVNTQARIKIETSIIGSIQVNQDEVRTDPISIQISDSILDATDPQLEAIGAPTWPMAHAIMTIRRSTVFGYIETHAIELAENSIFYGEVKVARRQLGCMRFCYVTPESRTPRRYNCQPDLVIQTVNDDYQRLILKASAPDEVTVEWQSVLEKERLRVRPLFNNMRYGLPTYAQLANSCAEEIKQGADDEAEMGVFHDLFQPQRAANLRVRLNEYTPADMNVGIIYAS